MLSETLFRQPRRSGVHVLQARGATQARELTTRRVCLEPGSSAELRTDGEETIVVLQQGAGAFECAGREWPVRRSSVFEERATALYVPPGETAMIAAESPLEAVAMSTPAPAGGLPAIAFPGDIRVNARGRGAYSREVHDIFVDDRHVRRLMLGETFNPPGHWSSFPPHKHDGRDGEPTLEEVYYFRVDPPQGFGQQMLYTSDDECVVHAVRDGDAVLLPYGYHPVSSPPGYRLYYLWGMAGQQRKLALHEDPAHRWIHQSSEI
jgi:5-deoxy-glucuronate isomerase